MMSNTKIVKQTALVNMSHYKKRVPATLFRKRINSAMCNFGLYYVCVFFSYYSWKLLLLEGWIGEFPRITWM